MAITRIRVPAKWHKMETDVRYGGEIIATAEFTLGVGPCGKTVVQLGCTIDASGVSVLQVCSDTERKMFFYPMHTLTGRVEITEE